MCVMLVCGVSAYADDTMEYLQRALVVNELKNYVDEHLAVFVEKAKNMGVLSEVDAELMVEYYRASVALQNASMIEMCGITGTELTAAEDTVIKANVLTMDAIIRLKDSYIAGEATWQESMAKVVSVIDTMISTSASNAN